MTTKEQLDLWVAGNPVHNGERDDPMSECCPDFSCCCPELLQPVEVREAFRVADEKKRAAFLGSFLGAMIAARAPDAKVHIAGSDPEGLS
jgi:hypothetical protein